LTKGLKISLAIAGLFIVPVLISPLPRFFAPASTVVEANDGSLLGARIAEDGQWRFPDPGQVPEKFEKALITFEDRYFYYHPGINTVSLIRAFIANVKAGKIVRGGSTITMQVIRISRKGRARTYGEKIIEMLAALKLELLRSKKTILSMYAANAPFGGNSVGLEAAAWRYYGKPPGDLTWAEAATLAVLPNSPSLVFPGKNQKALKAKRDYLLEKLREKEYLDSLTFVLSVEEPLPGMPNQLPRKTPHLTTLLYLNNKGKKIRTTIDPELQERVNEIINSRQKELENNYIYNSACIITDIMTGNVLAYTGNSSPEGTNDHGREVDIIQSERSTGSILKPFLYAGMLQSGDILPGSLVPDIPTRFSGFSPKNFDHSFSGAVHADEALSQSLNIPAVRMLQQFTAESFLNLLKRIGFTTFDKPAGHYGLSIILGGGETTLWELTGAYASMSRVLRRYNVNKKYYREDFHPPRIIAQNDIPETEEAVPPLSASSIWLTYEALQRVNRPESESGWQYFSSSAWLAWKTGTSFGFRDAWAIGTTPRYVIGVWAGNADGEGRPGLTGITAAAPILFEIASLLDTDQWFEKPDDLVMINTCALSGFRAGPDCPLTVEIPSCRNGLRSYQCPYHKIIHLNKNKNLQVTSDCFPANEIINEPWFVLSPAMEYYYRQKHPEYKILPPFDPRCGSEVNIPVMEFIYPLPGLKVFIPRDQAGSPSAIIAELVHRNRSKKIFWHLDENYIGTTKYIHQIELTAGKGEHLLTAVDEDGNTVRCHFTVTGRNNDGEKEILNQ
jgi:penicillin-binding protein 1C